MIKEIKCANCIFLKKLYVPPVSRGPKHKYVCILFADESGEVTYMENDKEKCECFTEREG